MQSELVWRAPEASAAYSLFSVVDLPAHNHDCSSVRHYLQETLGRPTRFALACVSNNSATPDARSTRRTPTKK